MIQNITLFARGVGRVAEIQVAYFGYTIASSTRRRLFDKLAGDDHEGECQKKTYGIVSLQCSVLVQPLYLHMTIINED